MGTQKNHLNETGFLAPKTYVKTDGQENIYNFKLKIFAYLNLWQYPSNLLTSSDNVAISCFINLILNDHLSKIPFLYILHIGVDATKPVFWVSYKI